MLNKINEIKNSKPYIEYHNYHKNNIFGLTKISRREEVHSNFIAWIFNEELNETFGVYPCVNFIKMLYSKTKSVVNNNAQIDESLKYKFYEKNYVNKVEIFTEFGVYSSKRRRFDILLHYYLNDGLILPIIIENKVNSKENDEQTVDYYNWGEKNYCDINKYHKPIYVYLTPQYNYKPPKQPQFISIKYQDLVDYVIEPTMWWTTDDSKKKLIKMYLQSLSFQNDNDKGAEIMAISKEEKKIIDDFINENKPLLISVLNSLRDNGSGEGISPDIIDEVTNNISERDTSQYEFLGETYGKGRLVLAVINQYINDNPGIDYATLTKAFPDKLQGAKGVVKLTEKVSDVDKGLKPTPKGKYIPRYFVNDQIKLDSTTEYIIICNQWGKDNIVKFIEHATQNLGYSILKK